MRYWCGYLMICIMVQLIISWTICKSSALCCRQITTLALHHSGWRIQNATHPSNHSHLCLLKCHLIFFSHGPVSLPCNILLHTQLLYNLPLTVNDISLLVSNGTNCLNLFHPIRILVSTAASASMSTLNMSSK